MRDSVSAWSSSGPRGHRVEALPSLQEFSRRQAQKIGKKKKTRADGALCAAALVFCLRWLRRGC